MKHISQETNLHNEVLILNRSVPSLKARREFRTQFYFFPCCLQNKKEKIIKTEMLVAIGMAGFRFI